MSKETTGEELSNCADNTAEQRARLRRTPTRGLDQELTHRFGNRLAEFALAVQLENTNLVNFYADELRRLFRQALAYTQKRNR